MGQESQVEKTQGLLATANRNEISVGKFGETTINSNRQTIINFCISNNLYVGNKFFQHQDIHKFTRVINRKQKFKINSCPLNNGKT